jgi:hypothetical protein
MTLAATKVVGAGHKTFMSNILTQQAKYCVRSWVQDQPASTAAPTSEHQVGLVKNEGGVGVRWRGVPGLSLLAFSQPPSQVSD